jgi:hypothetical protein
MKGCVHGYAGKGQIILFTYIDVSVTNFVISLALFKSFVYIYLVSLSIILREEPATDKIKGFVQ